MHELHLQEKQNLARLITHLPEEEKALILQVFEAFLEIEEHVSPEKLAEKLKEKGISLPLERVKEILEFFCRLGFAEKKEFLGQGPLYEHRHLGEHHDHLICTKCGKIQEFFHPQLESLKNEIAKQYGFKPLDHRLEIYGLCDACKATRAKPALPLVLVSSGEKVRVEKFLGGLQMKNKLASMGLVPGEEIEIINNCGPVIISVKGSRLALGQGVAQKILVSPLD